MQILYKISLIICCCFISVQAQSQFTITGTVYDSTKTAPVKDVTVMSSRGTKTITDSNGHYAIVATEKDSLVFIYQNKSTLHFAVSQVPNIGSFDICLHVRVVEKYKTLKEVKVYGKNYRQDSIENRDRYAKLFTYQKPGLKVNSGSYSGAAGLDLDELINVFRFKRNKQLKKMRQRLEEEEKEKYVDYRFNKITVKRVTRLEGADLDSFMKEYRPDYEFTASTDVVNFYQYILNASYEYKMNREKEKYINERFNRVIVKTITELPDKDLDVFMKKYRPDYEFCSRSNAQQFYDYIEKAGEDFKKQTVTPAVTNTADSSLKKTQ